MVIIGVDDMIEMILFLKMRFALIKLITCQQVKQINLRNVL